MPQVGESYRIDYGKGNAANKLIHIRAVVDGTYIVYRYWRSKWVYKMTDPTFFEVLAEIGRLKEEKHAGRE